MEKFSSNNFSLYILEFHGKFPIYSYFFPIEWCSYSDKNELDSIYLFGIGGSNMSTTLSINQGSIVFYPNIDPNSALTLSHIAFKPQALDWKRLEYEPLDLYT